MHPQFKFGRSERLQTSGDKNHLRAWPIGVTYMYPMGMSIKGVCIDGEGRLNGMQL